MTKKFKINYIIVPDFVFNNEALTYMSAKVYSFIHNFRMEEFFYGNERLAELFNCSERSISRAITQLEEEGFIKTRFDGRKRFIDDLFITHRVDKNVYPESPTLSTPIQAEESSTLSTLPQAKTAGLIRKVNKKSLGKNFEDEKDSEEFEAWRAAKRQKKQNKGRGVFQGRGFPPNAGSTPPYKEKKSSYTPKVVVDATDII